MTIIATSLSERLREALGDAGSAVQQRRAKAAQTHLVEALTLSAQLASAATSPDRVQGIALLLSTYVHAAWHLAPYDLVRTESWLNKAAVGLRDFEEAIGPRPADA